MAKIKQPIITDDEVSEILSVQDTYVTDDVIEDIVAGYPHEQMCHPDLDREQVVNKLLDLYNG